MDKSLGLFVNSFVKITERAAHWHRYDNYVSLGSLAREEYVYRRIMENSSLFNAAELETATNYITKLRGE